MNRRDFVKLSGMAGLSIFLPGTLSREAGAEPSIWGGPYFLHMHAAGGWDPTIFCDGKLTAPGTSPDYENRLVASVADINGIPVPETMTGGGKFLLRQQGNVIEDPAHFFQNAGKNMLVFNGLDTQTNNHETGVQGLACGHNDVELPALAALFAGSVTAQRDIPMAFLAAGQYNRTGDVVGVSRFPGDKVGLLSDPLKANANDENMLVSDVAAQRIAQLRAERLAILQGQASLPRNKRTINAVVDAAKGGATLSLLKDLTSGPDVDFESLAGGLSPDTLPYLSQAGNGGRPRFIDLGRSIEATLRCFQAGVSASATFAQGGFDTHSNHDDNQAAAMGNFVARLRYAILRAEQLGLANKLYILVTSDFGRTPRYNTGNGKDHWNVTSALLMGPGIRGGRAIGKTDEGQKAMRVAVNDVNQALDGNDPSGSRVHCSHLHRELRRVLGVDQSAFINNFPLPAVDVNLPLLA